MQTPRDTRPPYLVAAMRVALLALTLALVWGAACRSAHAPAAVPPRVDG